MLQTQASQTAEEALNSEGPCLKWVLSLPILSGACSLGAFIFFGGLIINMAAANVVLCPRETEGLAVEGKGVHEKLQPLGRRA